jgi:hypothetical protein
VQARRADLELLARLENIRLKTMTAVKDGEFDWKGAVDLYEQTFRDAGLDVHALGVEEAGERIWRSTVAVELAAALDFWALTRRRVRGDDDSGWRDLLRVARLADPDALRTRVREAVERKDQQALLAVASSVSRLPPATLSVVGSLLLADNQIRSPAEVFLRETQRRHPNDFWLNHILWEYCSLAQPPQW